MTEDSMIRRFTRSEYYTMAEAGILKPDERLELIEGEIFKAAPLGSRRAGRTTYLNNLLTPVLRDRAILTSRNPVHLDDYSETAPDIALVRWRSDFYSEAHPRPEDVLLVVEVADANFVFNSRVKMALYARHAIVEAWRVDLVQDVVEVHRDPSPSGYRDVRKLRRGDRLSCQAFPDLVVPVDYLLG